MDRIYIRELRLRCIIGIYPEERREKQDVVLTIVLEGDFSAAGRSDRIEDAVDYKSLKKRIIEFVEASSFNLIETLGARIADLCVEHPAVARATVTLDKPGALRFARSVAFETTRER